MDTDTFRVIETATIENLQTEIQCLARRLDEAEDKLRRYEILRSAPERSAYWISLVVITQIPSPDRPTRVDNIHFAKTRAEADEIQAGIFGRQHDQKRKVLIAQEVSLKNVPY